MRLNYWPVLILLACTAMPALAQRAPTEIAPRVDKLEREMRAVQRKVFPGGSQQFLDPEIAAPAPAPAPGVPASSTVDDLSARVGSLEQELQRLTGQVEQNSFKLRQLDEQFARFKNESDGRINTLEGRPGSPPASAAPAPDAPPPYTVPAKPAAATPPPAAGTSARVPSGDPAEDGYLAGYDLWVAKRYADAIAVLTPIADKYPNHRRASFARNLIGRALLDDGQPAKAAKILYENYQKSPRGERAPDSLYWLGQSLMALKPPKPADACKVYAELIDVYGEKIEQSLKDRIAKGKADAKCKATP